MDTRCNESNLSTRPAASAVRGRRQWISLQDRLLLTMAMLSATGLLLTTAASVAFVFESLAKSAVRNGPLTVESLQMAMPDVMSGVGGVLLAAMAMMLPTVYLIIARMFAPVRRLATAANNVAEGKFETVDFQSGDALGRLASAFNHMVERIAEQKRLADDANCRLLEANLHLERRIADRTAAIQAASQRLQSEIEEKEDFLRAVSHDLTAPLRNIDGMVTVLQRKYGEQLSQEVIRRLDRIKHNVQIETELIGEILELSRIKTRRDELEPVNAQDLVWDLRGLFENDLREFGIDLIVESQLPMLVVERSRMRQVFQNLIDNAIKYMGDSPTRRIIIGSQVKREETTFWVRDTGIGIAPEDAQKIFYVFRRGNNHSGVSGKGVGLASVKSIIENYQGTIWTAPNLHDGMGSIFYFTLNGQYVADSARAFRRDASNDSGPNTLQAA